MEASSREAYTYMFVYEIAGCGQAEQSERPPVSKQAFFLCWQIMV